MEEKKETKINGFDDTNVEKKWEDIMKRNRKNKKIDDNFLLTIINRIKMNLTSYEHELNSLPEAYKNRFIELYEKSTQE